MINFKDNGDGTGTVTIQYTNDLEKLRKGLEYAAKYIWGGTSKYITNLEIDPPEEVEVFFDDLTNAEKMDILNDWVRNQIIEQARLQIGIEKHQQASIDAENDDTIII